MIRFRYDQIVIISLDFYLLALLGGFLADAKFGRYLTVAIFSTMAYTCSGKS
jgi:dipeptide/tripeptide permease